MLWNDLNITNAVCVYSIGACTNKKKKKKKWNEIKSCIVLRLVFQYFLMNHLTGFYNVLVNFKTVLEDKYDIGKLLYYPWSYYIPVLTKYSDEIVAFILK